LLRCFRSAYRLADRRRAARRPLDLGLQPGPMLFVEQKEFVWG